MTAARAELPFIPSHNSVWMREERYSLLYQDRISGCAQNTNYREEIYIYLGLEAKI